MAALDAYFFNKVDVTKDFEAMVNSITAEEVAKFATSLLKQGTKITVIMTAPEAGK